MKSISTTLFLCTLLLTVGISMASTNWILFPQEATRTLTSPNDSHIYYFFAKEGETVSIKVQPAAGSALDPAFILMRPPGDAAYTIPVSPECANPSDSNEFEVFIAADDNPDGGNSAEINNYVIPACGTYMILVEPSNFASEGAYRLTVTPGDKTSNAIAYKGQIKGQSSDDFQVRSYVTNSVLVEEVDNAETLEFSVAGHSTIAVGEYRGNVNRDDISLRKLSDGQQYNLIEDIENWGVSPDGNHIITTGFFLANDSRRDLLSYNMPGSNSPEVRQETINSWEVAPDSETISVSGLFNSDSYVDLEIFALNTGDSRERVYTNETFEYSPTGEGLITTGKYISSGNPNYKVINARTGTVLNTPQDQNNYERSVFSPDGRYVAVFGDFLVNSNGDMRLYDFRGSVGSKPIIQNFNSGEFSPNGQVFIAYGTTGQNLPTARIYSMPGGIQVAQITNVTGTAQFSPDGEQAVFRGTFGFSDGKERVKFIQLPSGIELVPLGVDVQDIAKVRYSPDGNTVVFEGTLDDAPGLDYEIRRSYDLFELREYSDVLSMKFDPSGMYYSARGKFKNDPVIYWEVAQTFNGSSIFLEDEVLSVEFSPGGNAFWTVVDLDEDNVDEKFLYSLPDGNQTFSFLNDDLTISFDGWAPRGQSFLYHGDLDNDPQIEYVLNASPEGTELYVLEDIDLVSYSLNGVYQFLYGDFENRVDTNPDLQIRRTATGEEVYTIYDQDSNSKLTQNDLTFSRDEQVAVVKGEWKSGGGYFGFLIVRLAEQDTLFPTKDFDTYELSWDRFNPSFPQSEYQANFIGSAEGWIYGSAEPILAEPAFSAAEGRLTMQSINNNTTTFGFFNSPAGILPPPGDSIIIVEAYVQSNVANEEQTPNFRIRIGSDDDQVSSLLRVNSPPNPALTPGQNGRQYIHVYDPPVNAGELSYFLAIDMLNFDVMDDPYGDISIEEITALTVPRSNLSEQTDLVTYTFDGDGNTEGWRSYAYPYGSPPDLFWWDNALMMTAGSNYDSFGFWDGPLAAVQDVQEGLIYGAEFSIFTDEADSAFTPGFRVRHQDSGTSVISLMQILSVGQADVTVSGASQRTYNVILYAMQGMGGASLFPSLDLVAFDPSDNIKTIAMGWCRLYSMPLP